MDGCGLSLSQAGAKEAALFGGAIAWSDGTPSIPDVDLPHHRVTLAGHDPSSSRLPSAPRLMTMRHPIVRMLPRKRREMFRIMPATELEI